MLESVEVVGPFNNKERQVVASGGKPRNLSEMSILIMPYTCSWLTVLIVDGAHG